MQQEKKFAAACSSKLPIWLSEMFSVAEVIFSKRGLDVNMIERESELDKIAVLDFLKYQVPLAESLLEWHPLTHSFFSDFRLKLFRDH